jgi:hypothetical protein
MREGSGEETDHTMPDMQRCGLFLLALGEFVHCSMYISDHEDVALLDGPLEGNSRRWS